MTKPTAGVPYHPPPVITRVEFETTAGPDSAPAEKYTAQLLARTVGHLDEVNVGAILTAYLEEFMPGMDPDDCSDLVAEEILRLTALIETVLEMAKQKVANRMIADMATTLVPRLKGMRSV